MNLTSSRTVRRHLIPRYVGVEVTLHPYGRFRSVTHYRLIQKPCRRIPQVQEKLFGALF